MFQNLRPNVVFKWNLLVESCTREFFTKYPRYVQVSCIEMQKI